MTPYKEINPEPTDVQRATWRRHKVAGTSPGNPKWYKPLVIRAFEFTAGRPARLPHIETGAAWNDKYGRCSARVLRTEVVTRYKDGTTLARKPVGI